MREGGGGGGGGSRRSRLMLAPPEAVIDCTLNHAYVDACYDRGTTTALFVSNIF